MLLFSTLFRHSSQSFRGFDVQDVKQSENRLSSSKIELCDIPLPETPEVDGMHLDSTNDVIEPSPMNVEECNDQTDNADADMNQSDEQKLIVEEILEEVVETIIQDEKVRADSEHKGEATADMRSCQVGIESMPMPMPKDDPETAFFLSLS